MKNKTKNLLVTGCAGFIGSHAVDLFLELGYKVTGIDCLTYAANKRNLAESFASENFKFYEGNICDTNLVEKICSKHDIDWIVNFAAETHVDNSISNSTNFIESNISGVRSLLEVCSKLKIKIMQISTDEVYGSIKFGNFTEKSILNPKNPYSATKAAAEHMVTSYSNTYGVEYIIVRPSNNIGPRQHPEKFFPKLLNCLKNNLKIPIYGEGNQIREWLFVKDNVKAIEFIITNSNVNETYNIGSGNEITNIDLVRKVCELKNIDFKKYIKFVDDRKGHDFRYALSNEKLENLGFSNFTSLEKILQEAV